MNKKALLVICLLSLCMTACTTGNPELDEMVSNTLLAASSSLGDNSETNAEANTTDSETIAESIDTENQEDKTNAEQETFAEDTDPAVENTDPVPEDPAETNAEPMPYENSMYAYLQAKIAENDCMGGVMYIELVSNDWNEDYIRECLEYDRVSDYLPVFASGAVVLGEGEQLYALLPAEGAWISIYPSEITEDAAFIDNMDAPLYEGKVGEPILLRCNYSDTYSNVYVTVQNEEAMYELRPNASTEYAYMMTPTDGWYDIAPLDIRSLGYETLQWFQFNYGFELEEGLNAGYALEYMGPEYHYNHYVLKFGLYRGMDDDSEEIDIYAEYAVDFTYTYRVNQETGNYEVIGDGMHFDTIEDVEMYLESLDSFENADGAVG